MGLNSSKRKEKNHSSYLYIFFISLFHYLTTIISGPALLTSVLDQQI